jgi:hypothetical protein
VVDAQPPTLQVTALVGLGYTQARPTDGLTIVEESTVYFFDGFEREAELVAIDLGIDPFRNAPVADAPEFGQLVGNQVAVYLGPNRRSFATLHLPTSSGTVNRATIVYSLLAVFIVGGGAAFFVVDSRAETHATMTTTTLASTTTLSVLSERQRP